MTYEEFYGLVKKKQVDKKLSPLLQALLIEALGDWDSAHGIAQEDNGRDGARVHAYLHRREGDLWNSNYWYRYAGMEMPDYSLDQEWEVIAKDLLNR